MNEEKKTDNILLKEIQHIDFWNNREQTNRHNTHRWY